MVNRESQEGFIKLLKHTRGKTDWKNEKKKALMIKSKSGRRREKNLKIKTTMV